MYTEIAYLNKNSLLETINGNFKNVINYDIYTEKMENENFIPKLDTRFRMIYWKY